MVGLSVKGTLVELAIRVLVGMLVGLPVVGLSVKAMLVCDFSLVFLLWELSMGTPLELTHGSP